jgi:hypothetical protein
MLDAMKAEVAGVKRSLPISDTNRGATLMATDTDVLWETRLRKVTVSLRISSCAQDRTSSP